MFTQFLERLHQVVVGFYIACGALLLVIGLWMLATKPLFGEEFYGNLIVVGMGAVIIGYGLLNGTRARTLRVYFFGFAALVWTPGAVGLAIVSRDLSSFVFVLLAIGIASIGAMILVKRSHAEGSNNHVPLLYAGLAFFCAAFVVAGWIESNEDGWFGVLFWALAAWFAVMAGLLFYQRSIGQRDQNDG